jgi:hypothetical protein
MTARMTKREIDIAADSDDDEIEVVVVDRYTVAISQKETIDLTEPDEEARKNTRRSNGFRALADTEVRRNMAIIDLYGNSDDDVTVLSSTKPPAKPVVQFRPTESSDDVVIVESPMKSSEIIKTPPKTFPCERTSSAKKRSHTEIAVSAPVLVDLTDFEGEGGKREKSPDTSSSKLSNQQSFVSIKQISGTLNTIQPTLTAPIDSQSDSLHLSSAKSEAPNTAGDKGSSSSPISPRARAGDILKSASSSSCTSHGPSDSEKVHAPPSTLVKATQSSSIEAESSPSYDDNNRDSEDDDTSDGHSTVSTSSDSDQSQHKSTKVVAPTRPSLRPRVGGKAIIQRHSKDNDTSDSQSTVSTCSDSNQSQNKSTKVVAPIRPSLRPRVGGKAIVQRHSVLKNVSTLKVDNITDSSNFDNHEAGATMTLSYKVENGSTSTHNSGIAKTERPTRASKIIAKRKIVRQMKSSSKRLRNSSPRRSNRKLPHLKHADVTKVAVREQDQLDDSESTEDCSTGIDDDSTTSLSSVLNTNKDQEAKTITINRERLASRSGYQHYDMIDDMIMNAKKQENDSAALGSLPMVRAGESRFFAPQYSGHKDLIQWVTYIQPLSRQVDPNYLSIYLPCDADVE